MSGASKAIYELVTGIFSTKADDIIDPGPEELTDLAGQVFRSELPQLKNRTFETKEAMRKVEGNINRSLTKKPKEPKEAFETNPMFMEVDETPKQKAIRKDKERIDFFDREENYKITKEQQLLSDASRYDPDSDEYVVPISSGTLADEQMENLTTFDEAFSFNASDPLEGRYVNNYLRVSGVGGDEIDGSAIFRKDELISFYSTLDNTVDEIFKRTAKNRPGEKGIRGSDLLKRFADSEVKQSELKFINFNSRIKKDEFYTEADLRDVIGKSGIRVVANIKKNSDTRYGNYQRQIADPMDIDGRTSLVDTGEPVQDLQYFEITLDVFPNFNKKDPDFEGAKLDYIKGNLGNQKRGAYTHYNQNTLAHIRGSILEMSPQPGGRERGPTAREKILLIEELQSDAFRVATAKEKLKKSDGSVELLSTPEGYNSSRVVKDKDGNTIREQDDVAFSKDEPRSRSNLVAKRPTIFKDFAAKRKENIEEHPSMGSFNNYHPKFTFDVYYPGTDRVLVKKGKNVSRNRLKKLANEGVIAFDADFFSPTGEVINSYLIGEAVPQIKPAKSIISRPIGMSDEDYFGTIVSNPQRVDRKVPISGDSDYVLKLIQAAIVHAKQNGVDKIVIPSADLMAQVRGGYSRGSEEFLFYAKVYEQAVNKVLKNLERSFKGKIKTGNYPLSTIDMRFEGIYGDSLKLEKERSSKFLDISKLDLNLDKIMARFSRGGLVTSPSNGLMSR